MHNAKFIGVDDPLFRVLCRREVFELGEIFGITEREVLQWYQAFYEISNLVI